MRGKRKLRRAIRLAKRLANKTGLPQKILWNTETQAYQIITPCDNLKVTQRPQRASSKSWTNPGKPYIKRHPRKKSTIASPRNLIIYPGKSTDFAVPDPGKIQWKVRRDRNGRFSKYGPIFTIRSK